MPRDGLAVAAIIAAQALGGDVRLLSWLGLIVWSFTGVSAALRALALGVILLFLNPLVMPPPDLAVGLLRWLLLLSATAVVTVAQVRRPSLPGWALALGVYGATCAVLALAVSPAVSLSLAKLGLFVAGFLAVGLGVRHTAAFPWERWLFTVYAALVATSVPFLILSPGFLSGRFRGVLGQPQLFGILILPVLVWATARAFLESPDTVHWVDKGFTLLGWPMAVLSASRTAVFAAVIALVVAAVYAFFFRRGVWQRLARVQTSRMRMALAAVTVMGMMLAAERLAVGLGRFVLKYEAGSASLGSVAAAMADTRLSLVQAQWANFRRNPWTGIGFGIPTEWGTLRSYAGGLGTVAAGSLHEKGVLVSAVLEETGVPGALLLLAFFWALALPVFRRGGYAAMVLFLTAVLVNFGEMVFFAAGASGVYVWFFLAVAGRSAQEPEAPAAAPEPRAELPRGEPRGALAVQRR
jgi:hypothetical protein